MTGAGLIWPARVADDAAHGVDEACAISGQGHDRVRRKPRPAAAEIVEEPSGGREIGTDCGPARTEVVQRLERERRAVKRVDQIRGDAYVGCRDTRRRLFFSNAPDVVHSRAAGERCKALWFPLGLLWTDNQKREPGVGDRLDEAHVDACVEPADQADNRPGQISYARGQWIGAGFNWGAAVGDQRHRGTAEGRPSLDRK